MNIFHILNYAPEFGGGIAKHLLALGELAKLREDKLIIGFPQRRKWQHELSSISEIIIIPEIKNAVSISFPIIIHKICKRHSIDILHIHFAFAMAFSLACTFKKWKIPTIYHWHNPPIVLNEFLTPQKKLSGKLKRLSSRTIAKFTDHRVIDRHISISKEITELLVSNNWTTQKKITYLPNGVTSLKNSTAIHREKSNRIRVIGTVANFRAQKDHITLLKAFSILLSAGMKCELWIIGDGPTRPAIEKLTNELGIKSSVRFLGTLLNPNELLRVFDVFVLSTNYEGHPLVILEAMSFGLPIIATRISSIPEVIIDRTNGLLVNPKDPNDLARAFKDILSDEVLYKRLSLGASESFTKQLTVEDWAKQVISIYQSLLTSKAK